MTASDPTDPAPPPPSAAPVPPPFVVADESVQLPPMVASPTGPVAEQSRLLSLDVARAVALLGIFFVNALIFGEPFAEIVVPHVPAGEGLLGHLAYWFTMVFCAGKFYPMFSLLFGVGLAIMLASARRSGRSFHAAYFRRLLLLAVFGILHIALLWAGDILLIYAAVGLWMLLFANLRARTLVILGVCVFAFGLLLATSFTALGLAMGQGAAEVTPRPMPAGDTPLDQWLAVLRDWNQDEQYDSRLKELEITILRDGPLLHAMILRAFNYAYMMVFVIFVMGWQVIACFCIGAALLKSGFFHGERPAWRRRFIALGLLIGLPLNILASIGTLYPGHLLWGLLMNFGMQFGGPLMSLMYIALVMAWVDSGRAAGLAGLLANLGRMGLTGYILESFLMCAVMLHWGLGMFGSTTWAGRAGLLLGFYLLILVIANLWMRTFRFGPLEWLWRTGTYLKFQPMLRRAGD